MIVAVFWGFGATCVLTETRPQLAGQDDVVVNLGEMSIAGLLLGFRRVASCAGLRCVMCCSVVCEFACWRGTFLYESSSAIVNLSIPVVGLDSTAMMCAA